MPVYSYMFDFKTERGMGEMASNNSILYKPAHGEDITLLFNIPQLRNETSFSAEEIGVRNLLLDMYETFARTG